MKKNKVLKRFEELRKELKERNLASYGSNFELLNNVGDYYEESFFCDPPLRYGPQNGPSFVGRI